MIVYVLQDTVKFGFNLSQFTSTVAFDILPLPSLRSGSTSSPYKLRIVTLGLLVCFYYQLNIKNA